jgi:hypothetical protein
MQKAYSSQDQSALKEARFRKQGSVLPIRLVNKHLAAKQFFHYSSSDSHDMAAPQPKYRTSYIPYSVTKHDEVWTTFLKPTVVSVILLYSGL